MHYTPTLSSPPRSSPPRRGGRRRLVILTRRTQGGFPAAAAAAAVAAREEEPCSPAVTDCCRMSVCALVQLGLAPHIHDLIWSAASFTNYLQVCTTELGRETAGCRSRPAAASHRGSRLEALQGCRGVPGAAAGAQPVRKMRWQPEAVSTTPDICAHITCHAHITCRPAAHSTRQR